MKVTFINYALETFTPTQSGALATIIRECCLAARRQGIEPTVLTGHCTAEPYKDVRTVFVDPPRSPRSRVDHFLLRAERKLCGYHHLDHRGYISRVCRAVREHRLDQGTLILQNDPELTVILRREFPRTRIIHWFQNQQGAKERFRRQFSGTVDAVAAVSAFTARWVEGYYGLARGVVNVAMNGVEPKEFCPADVLLEGRLVIGFVGRTGIEKAPDLLLKAALKIANERTDFAIQILGSNHWDRFEMDDYQRELCALVEQLEQRGIEVRRPGFIGRYQLPDELRRCSIHVVPSRWEEPCALAILEGLATGVPVVASRTGGTPELIGEAGLLFERDSADSLADCLKLLLSNSALRSHYAIKSRERALQLTWDSTWASIYGLIEPVPSNSAVAGRTDHWRECAAG
jgi:glycosyltransferase involved in cell wall biosynthesis